ncbi:efflux RND transporter periplasmic adaptor subunit, partial [Balneatrix alpica]|uniref:Efflux RND transporter periplasmic adaptor subunit n=1 Tax=Balneatrix alpica TaxID=75684 RepID=A0ABV5ZCU7_9GAMM
MGASWRLSDWGRKAVLPVLVIALALAAFYWLKQSKTKPPARPIQEKVWPVQSMRLQSGKYPAESDLFGAVETPAYSTLSAASSSEVVEVLALEGDSVRQGQPLIKLDERDLQLQLQQRQAELAELDARIEQEYNRHQNDLSALEREQQLVKLAQQSVERQQQLASSKVSAQVNLDEAKRALHQQQLSLLSRRQNIADHPARLAQLKAQHSRLRAQLQQTELDLARTTITAPFAGRIAKVNVSQGERVSPGTALVSLYPRDRLEVRALIADKLLAQLQPLLQQGISIEAELNSEQSKLPLLRLASELNPSRGGVDAFFALPGDTQLELGRRLQLTLKLPPRQDSFAVPPQALYANSRVFIIEDSRLKGVEVRVLGEWRHPSGQRWPLVIAPELQAGQLLLTTALANAMTGLKVRVQE